MINVSEVSATQGLQQQLLKDSQVDISMKFGFLGLGMGGCSIAAACADIEMGKKNMKYPYTSLLINTNKVDLDKIEAKNSLIKKMIIGNGKGAGRNLSVGEEIFKDNKEKILNEVKTQFEGSDFIWIVAGLGGGTGTGSIIQAAELLYRNGFQKKFGLILTLPRKSEGRTVLSNALERLQTITKLMSSALGSVIVVDNQKLYDYYTDYHPNASVSDYLKFSNQYVAETLHELNIVTASFKPYGEYHFDSSEFENLIKTPGILHLSKFSVPANSVDTEQSLTYVKKLEENIHNGVLSDGFKIDKASRLAISIVSNENNAKRIFNMQFNNAIEHKVKEISPIASERPVAQYQYDIRNRNEVYFYAVFAGLSLPSSIKELIVENQKLEELENAINEDEDDVLSALSGFSRSTKKEIIEDDPFNSLDSTKKKNEDKKDVDPFDLI
ncbi:plasmid replication protein [Anaerobacillus arseniciselenatis]|uniref:Plasmid replication protein n=1 Tax=Anaerobacillus arseniciselenatis TaxID=85682 RepID=A0A1S2LAC9_9BACI|nr:plasmid replication protein [Anaerobacillus arseniciselenatis]OIJ09448.1 plasmid replication protein [Anaerobacillus arseniciselenatis]